MSHVLALQLVRLRPGQLSDALTSGDQRQWELVHTLWCLGLVERVPSEWPRVRLTAAGVQERERVLQEARELLEASP